MKYSSSRVHHISGEEKGEVVYTSSRRKESLLSGAERPLQVRLRCHLPKLDSTPALQLLKRRKPYCQSSRYKQEQTKEHAVWCAQHGTARGHGTLITCPSPGTRRAGRSDAWIQPNALSMRGQQLLSPPRTRIHRDQSGF